VRGQRFCTLAMWLKFTDPSQYFDLPCPSGRDARRQTCPQLSGRTVGPWVSSQGLIAMSSPNPPVPPQLPLQGVLKAQPPTELAAGQRVYRWNLEWDGAEAVLLSADAGSPGQRQLQSVMRLVGEMGKRLGTPMLLASSDDTRGTWAILSSLVDEHAARRLSVTVSGRAGRGTVAQCKDALAGALELLSLISTVSSKVPAGVDWIACDQRSCWVLNVLDAGLWSPDSGRSWHSAAYDVAWTVALGREPSMRDPAPWKAIASCPPEFANYLERLVGHAAPAFSSPGEALAELRRLRPRRVLRGIAITAAGLAVVGVVMVAWMDARIAARARAIDERSDVDAFARRQELSALVAQHPMLMLWRGEVKGRLVKLESDCSSAMLEWRSKVRDALARPANEGAALEHAIAGLVEASKPFADAVATERTQLDVRLTQVRAEIVLANPNSSLGAIVDSARKLREAGLGTDPALGKLQIAADDARWKALPPPPVSGATPQQIYGFLDALEKYLAGADEDQVLGGKFRRHADEARRIKEEVLEELEEAKLSEINGSITRHIQRGTLNFAASEILQALNAPHVTGRMKQQLSDLARKVASAQAARIQERIKRRDPDAEIAKDVIDWQKEVGRSIQAFPPDGVKALAAQVMAHYVDNVIGAKQSADIPPYGNALKQVAMLVSGSASDNVGAIVECMHNGLGTRSMNSIYRAFWHYNAIAPEIGLKSAKRVHRYPGIVGIGFWLKARVEDHIGNDWIVKVDAGHYPFVDQAGSERAADLERPIQYLIPEADGMGELYVLEGIRLPITVWDDDWGDSDPLLLKGFIVFVDGGIRVEAMQGRADAVDVRLLSR
jgi:hypothetical protein